MVVQTQCKGREVTGLKVGAANVRRYFPREVAEIELYLDHLQIQCGLRPEFWDGDARIEDRRLCAWLAQKNFHGTLGKRPLPMAMVPEGERGFRLRQIGATEKRGKDSAAAAGKAPGQAAVGEPGDAAV